MADKTTNYNLIKPLETEFYNVEDHNGNMDIIDEALLNNSIYSTAGGTATAIILTMQTLRNGYAKTFIASANNGGAETTINTKKLYKPSTTTAPTLTAGKAYTVWYNLAGDCFFLKASAEGSVLASQVYKDATYSTEDGTGLKGTMPVNGALSGTLNCGSSYTIPLGYTTGGNITANSLASQTVASATANQILYGITAWINGSKVTGTMINRGAVTITPSTANQTIGDGYHNGSGSVIGDSNLIASNIISGKDIFGVAGSASIESLGGKRGTSGYSPAGMSTSVTLSFVPSVVLARHTTENSFFVLLNTPSLVGLNTAMVLNRLTSLSSSNYGAITPHNATTTAGAPCIYIVGNVLHFEASNSTHSYQYYAFN